MTTHVSALGIRTRVIEAGDRASEEAVVLVHGVPGSADHWIDLLPRIGAFTRVVAFDLPGFGEADRPPEWDYSSNGYGNFTGAVLHELGIRCAHLVMHDLGGTALTWAAANPDSCASVVLIDTGVIIGRRRWHAVGELYRAPLLGSIAERTGRLGVRQVMRFYTSQPRPLPPGIVDDWVKEYDRGARRALKRFYRTSPASSFARLAASLRRHDKPALVVWGAHDRFLGVDQAERQREAFPSAEVVVLPDSGHYAHLDDPEGVADAVVPFLRRQVSTAA